MANERHRGPPERTTDPDLQRFADDALVLASEQGDYDRARAAIAAGANASVGNDLPLQLAAAHGHTEIVRLLLLAGADKSVHDHRPLRDAEKNGHHETAGVLREAGSYSPTVKGDFERGVADRAVRAALAEGAPESSDTVRARVLRVFDLRRRQGRKDHER